ncbi:MAG TPA: hypothetical protein VIC54_05935 [Terriglobales bacterium]|jgi:hypothetical protein|nr:hypothetical protein [Terriglobales bacterium]
MSKRLQVLVSEEEMAEIKAAARRRGVPVGEWARRVMREARGGISLKDPEVKLAALRAMAAMNLPTADIEQMIQESVPEHPSDLP